MPASVKGAVALRKSLRAFAPDLAKALPKEIGTALKPITKAARGYLPNDNQVLSGWLPKEKTDARFPTYTARIARAGISFKITPSKPNRQGFRSLVSLFNKSAAGAIYETMGRKTPSSQFVQNQNTKYAGQMRGRDKMQGRALFKAYDENNGKARVAVLAAIKNAADNLNKRSQV